MGGRGLRVLNLRSALGAYHAKYGILSSGFVVLRKEMECAMSLTEAYDCHEIK